LLSFTDEVDEENENTSDFKPISGMSKLDSAKKNLKRTRESIDDADEEYLNTKSETATAPVKIEEDVEKKEKTEEDIKRDKIREETQKIIQELKSKKRKVDPELKKSTSEAKEMLRKQREKYARRQKPSENEILSVFENFRSKIHNPENDSWVNHRLKFEKDDEIKVKDPSLQFEEDDGGLMVYDPLKDYKPGDEERFYNKHQQKLRAKKNLEKW